jgi:hypothetical protein
VVGTIAAVIFGVGLIKTGTTSLGDACEILGMRRLGWFKKGAEHGHQLMKLWDGGDLDALFAIARRYDVVEDFPWALIYPELAAAFPDAKFVLTRRITPEKWLQSAIKHKEGSRGYGMHAKVFGSKFPGDAPDLWLAKYDSHNAEVRALFAGTDRLLEVCWEEGDGWNELCPFLGLAVPEQPFPHSNKMRTSPRPPRQHGPWVARKAKRLQRRVGEAIRR